MAESIVSFVLEKLYQVVTEEGTLWKEFPREFADIKDELESIQAFLKDADRRAAAGGGGGVNNSEGIRTWVKQLREVSFRIEDVIDEYTMNVEAPQRVNNNHFAPGRIAKAKASVRMLAQYITKMKQRHKIASEIQDLKSSFRGIKERSARYEFQAPSTNSLHEVSAESSRGTRLGDPRMNSHFITEVVGFESPRDELVGWLVNGTNELVLVSVVGMGGLGKTTLAKHVFDYQQVKNHFEFCIFIIVSQSYTARGLLIEIIKKFCKDSSEPIPTDLYTMDDNALVSEVRQYLESKRYLVLFDDVWREDFCDEIEHAMIDNKKGSRIIITTRNMPVADYYKKSFPVHVHSLKPLSQDKAWELFCKKTFRSESVGQCPAELEKMSKEIVQKCGGLPLAILAIGGLLSTKANNMFEWRNVSTNLRAELGRNVHLTSLTRILLLSYDDLPHRLKSCMLYFGIYPEDYTINRKTLTRQWMAEGFVKYEEGRTMEEVAEGYLIELIQRSLVQVSRKGFDEKVKSCQVHDLLRDIIIGKMKDLSFCHLMHEDDDPVAVGITRRFSIPAGSNNILRSTGNKGIRAVFVFHKDELPEHFLNRLCAKFKLLKVLDFGYSLLNHVPNDLGNLFHLRYLNLSHTKVDVLPRSIGMLVNLETLDLRQTLVHELPREINKLTKLRLLPVYYRKYEGHYSATSFTTGVKMQKGIGCLQSLQKLYFLEADHDRIDLIEELKMLTQLRKLGIRKVQSKHGNALSAAIQEMNQLESLNIGVGAQDEVLDMDMISAPSHLRVLNLKARLTKLPDWIPKLEYLVKLRLVLSNLEDDPLESLKKLPNLLRLNMWDNAFAGGSLHFQVGGFPKLKELDLTRLNSLSSISIDEGALLNLEHFRFNNNPQLKVVPQDLEHLKNLKFLGFADMPTELVESIDPDKGGQSHRFIEHISVVRIRQKVGPRFHDYELRHIPTRSNNNV